MGYVIGVDVGGTKVLIGKVLRDGTFFDERMYPSRRGTQETATSAVVEAVGDYCGRLTADEEPEAIGVGLVGQVDQLRGVWMHSLATPITTPYPIGETLSGKTGIPCYADNDVHCATLAEMRYGVGRMEQDFVYLNLGTGIAAGLVSEGRLIRGARNRAGEVGHMSCALVPSIHCGCGRDNCVEWFASGGGMIRFARELFKCYPDSELVQLDERGELFSRTIFQSAVRGDLLGGMIAEMVLCAMVSMFQDIINMMDPAAIVVGGGMLNGGWLLPRVIERVSAWLPPSCSDLADRIFPSMLDPQKVGLLGAATNAFLRIGGF